MNLSSQFIIAITIVTVHLLTSFNLKLSDKYKNKFRMYSIIISLAFILFLAIFSFSSLIWREQGINIYFNGLSTFYFALFAPLGIALLWCLYKWIIYADVQPTLLKYVVISIFFIMLIGLIYLGYSLFIFFFYGLAP